MWFVLVLRRAANAGEGRAAFLLATTFDLRGNAADRAQATFWYKKARALGFAEASKRLQVLEASR
jgi:TPR repeat protein